jgi:hypothetical protein
LREIVAWDRATLRALYGLPLGFEYTFSIGSVDMQDALASFAPMEFPASAEVARVLGIAAGDKLLYLPRRAFDLWGSRYFIVPVDGEGWANQERPFASLLYDVDLIYPQGDRFKGKENRSRRIEWQSREDWQLLRNRSAFPRAWVVHRARVVRPLTGADETRNAINGLIFANDAFWKDPGREVFDLRTSALVETDDRERLSGYLSADRALEAESVDVVEHHPWRVVLRASLRHPGLVILAETYYPGWHLTIDGKPAPIYRANRMMRGATVPEGEHILSYTYDPLSFRVGAIISVAALTGLAVVGRRWR